jgi:hypothetical protein
MEREIYQGCKSTKGRRSSETLRSAAGRKRTFGGGHGLDEGKPWSAQQEEQFASPEQNIQQASALKIAEIFRVEADVERLSRAFLDEGAHGDEVDGFRAELAPPRIKALKLLITTQQEMVQAESLAIQCSNRGAATRTHPAVSFLKHRNHFPQAH